MRVNGGIYTSSKQIKYACAIHTIPLMLGWKIKISVSYFKFSFARVNGNKISQYYIKPRCSQFSFTFFHDLVELDENCCHGFKKFLKNKPYTS